MPFFEDEQGFLKRKKAMRQAVKIARRNATPELADNVRSLMRDYPWLQPGTAYGMAQQGITGEKAWKVAAYDLYYQANETTRFGNPKPVETPQERLIAWDHELRNQIRAEKKIRDINEKAGSAFGPTSEVANTNPARVARFGNAGLDEIKAMRRTVRAALATNDPATMNAILMQMQQRSELKQDPYDVQRSQGIDRANLGDVASFAPRVAGMGLNVLDKATGGSLKATVRSAAVAANMGQEGLAGVERGVVGFVDDARSAFGLDQVGQPGFQRPSGVQSGQTGLDPLSAAKGMTPYEEAPNGLKGLNPYAILEQTQGGQALIDLVHGDPVDTGTGWLPSYESETAKAAAEASRKYSPYLVGGHAWTVGRASADFARLEPDSTPFTIVSGTVDAWQAWQLDPANFALSALADANRARKLFDLDEAGNVVNRVNAIEDVLDAKRAGPQVTSIVDPAREAEKAMSAVEINDQLKAARRWERSARVKLGQAHAANPITKDPTLRAAGDAAVDAARAEVDAAAARMKELRGRLRGARTPAETVTTLDETTAEGWKVAVEGGEPVAEAARKQILADAGVHVGRRAWMRAKNPVDWLYGKGTPIVQAIAKESDPWTIYWAMNGRVPIKSDTGQNVLEYLARAETEGDVRRVLAAELGTSIDRIPKWRRGILARPAPRLLSDVPTGVINPDNADETAHTLINALKMGKVPVEDQRRVFNAWVMAEGRGDRYAAMDAAWDLLEVQVRAAVRGKWADAAEGGGIKGAAAKVGNWWTSKPMSDKKIQEFFRRNKDELGQKRGSLYGVDSDTGKSNPILLLDENGRLKPVDGPRVPTERWNSSVVLPDMREIRRLVANPLWQKIVNNPVWYAGMALADGYQDLWKFMVLIRGAWPVRVIGDEMLRMSATGQSPFVHPASYMAQVIGNPNDSKVFRWMERLGRKPTQEAVDAILNERNTRWQKLIADGMDPEEARALVRQEMPLPANFGKRWAEQGRKLRTNLAANQVDIGNAPFDINDLYGEALTSRIIRDKGVTRRVYLNHFDSVDRTEGAWSRGLVEELYRAFSEPVSRRALRMDTDQFLEGLWTEKWGRDARAQMAAGRDATDPWRRVLDDRAASDQYGRQILDHLQQIHKGDQRLIDAMVTGNFKFTNKYGEDVLVPLTYGGHASDEAIGYADVLKGEMAGPDNLKVQRTHTLIDDVRNSDKAALDNFVNGAFDFLMTKPSNYLTRSPTFRNKYWDEVERLLPAMDQATQARLRKTLNSRALTLEAGRKEAILAKMDEVGYGKLSFDEADTILKRRALDYTRGLLYDLHKKSQFFDAARLVFPFGEAWKEVMTTWYKILSQNPNALRRTQQVIQGAREAAFDPVTGLPTNESAGEGFLRHDPQTGDEVFTYPLTGWMSQQDIDIPIIGKISPDSPIAIPLRGSASSLNMVLSGLPGFGPVASIPISEVVDSSPKWDKVRAVVFPFGEPGGNTPWSKALNGLISNWGKKVEQAASDPRMDRMQGNMVFDMMAVLASTGEYKFYNDKDATYELTRLYNDAKKKAQDLGWMRALGAFTLPASPGIDWYAEDKSGNVMLLQTMKDMWNEKRDKLYANDVPNASNEAFRWFIRKFGKDNVFATQAKSTLNVAGLEPTKEMRNWEGANADLVTSFPKTWALFAPADGEYAYDAYIAQLERGYRDPQDPMSAARSAVGRLADREYDYWRKQYEPLPERQRAVKLADIRRQIREQFPGSTPGAYSGDDEQVARLAELELAAKNPTLSKTDLGKALDRYFAKRDELNREVAKNPKFKSASFTSSKETARYRDQLYDFVDDLSAEYDGFAKAWDEVLSREFKEYGD